MPKLTKRIVDAAEAQPTEFFVWDSASPASACGAAERAQGLRGAIPRRTPLAPDQPRAQHGADLRAGAHPGHHHRRRRAQRRGSGRRARCRAQGDHGQGTGGAVRQGAYRHPREGKHGEGISPQPQRFILPALGQLAVTGITRADVAKFHHDLRHIPYQANRCLEVVSKMFSLWPRCGACARTARTRASTSGNTPRKSASGSSAPPNCAGSARCCGRWRRRDRAALGHPGRAAADPDRLPPERDHDAEMGLRRFDERALRLPDSKTGKPRSSISAILRSSYLRDAPRIGQPVGHHRHPARQAAQRPCSPSGSASAPAPE
jgi:hypothetical protein